MAAGPINVIKVGYGTQTLNAANTPNTGSTTVTAGTLILTNANLCDSATLTIASGAVLNLPASGIDTVGALVINGVSQPVGLYQASNTGGAITGPGVIQVGDAVITPSYFTWAASFAGLTDSYPTHDPDGDGLINDQEYAFGLDPSSGASVNPIRVPLDKTTGTFSYSRNDPATTSLSYTVDTSLDLNTWTVDAAATQTVTQLDSGVQTVQVTLSRTKPITAPQIFVRVMAR